MVVSTRAQQQTMDNQRLYCLRCRQVYTNDIPCACIGSSRVLEYRPRLALAEFNQSRRKRRRKVDPRQASMLTRIRRCADCRQSYTDDIPCLCAFRDRPRFSWRGE